MICVFVHQMPIIFLGRMPYSTNFLWTQAVMKTIPGDVSLCSLDSCAEQSHMTLQKHFPVQQWGPPTRQQKCNSEGKKRLLLNDSSFPCLLIFVNTEGGGWWMTSLTTYWHSATSWVVFCDESLEKEVCQQICFNNLSGSSCWWNYIVRRRLMIDLQHDHETCLFLIKSLWQQSVYVYLHCTCLVNE